MKLFKTIFFLLTALILGCSTPESYDIIIRNGQIIDGTGSPSFIGDIGINTDTITKIGTIKNANSLSEIDAQGLVVAPGFINMLSWATESLIEDGRSQSDIRQGVTLEVMGEGESMGPLNDWLKNEMKEAQQDIKFDIEWTTLSEYLEFLERKGVSTNITSFLGNASLRLNVMGYENRPPTQREMEEMKDLTRKAMEEGAVGLSTALVYVPSGHANTEEIIELAKVVAEYDGMYISHIRDEESGLLNAMDEFIAISREANIRSEIYHFKASGNENWHLMDQAIKLIENARNEGLEITTDMYMYNGTFHYRHGQKKVVMMLQWK